MSGLNRLLTVAARPGRRGPPFDHRRLASAVERPAASHSHANRLSVAPVNGPRFGAGSDAVPRRHGSHGGPRRPGHAAAASATFNRSGFTLLEVLVALAILSLAIVVSIQGFASGLRLLKLSGEHQEAMLLADLKAREITSPTQAGRDGGIEGAYTWEREIKQVVTPDLEVEGRPVRWRQWEVDVHVRWGDHRQVSVATLRTVAGDGDKTPTSPKP